ncbi:MAG: hypothetical protein H0X27_11000 [Caulobacteraceae bacterium]|nr:hypothetical protein [Caulobacteraceae bacterium]
MTVITRLGAFDTPFKVRTVGTEILIESDQAPFALVLTADCARETAKLILDAVEEVETAPPPGAAPR